MEKIEVDMCRLKQMQVDLPMLYRNQINYSLQN